MAKVESIHISLRSGIPSKALDQVQFITDHGLEGDAKARPGGKRQVLIIPGEVLDEFDLEPGQVKENIVTRGIDLMSLPRGTHLRVGDALLELTLPCAPCGLLDDIRPGLQDDMRGQRGQLFRVLEGGAVQVGDQVAVVGQSDSV